MNWSLRLLVVEPLAKFGVGIQGDTHARRHFAGGPLEDHINVIRVSKTIWFLESLLYSYNQECALVTTGKLPKHKWKLTAL